MCEALAALRLGFVSQQVRSSQEMVWQGQAPAVSLVTNTLMEADRALHGLSKRMNNYQRSTIVELWRRLYDSLSIAPERLLVCANATGNILKNRQQELWNDLRAMLAVIITAQPRLGAWFDIGDRLADISWQAYQGRLSLPFTPQQWDFLYSGVDRLSRRERRIIGPFFPAAYNDRLHLACQLVGSYRGLCGLLQSVGDDILAAPKWSGVIICYRGRQAVIRRQANSVIIPILDEFEKAGWPEHLLLPKSLDGDVKQAIYHFNKLGVIRLCQDGACVRW